MVIPGGHPQQGPGDNASLLSAWQEADINCSTSRLAQGTLRYILQVEPFWAPAWMSPSLEDMNMESQQLPEKDQELISLDSDTKPICTWQFHTPSLTKC